MEFNLATMLRESAKRCGDKVAVILDDRRLTYTQLDAMSDRVAASLAARGIGPGDAIGLQLPNVPEFVITYFGILKSGAVVVPMNTMLKAPEIAFYLGHSKTRLLITCAEVAREAAQGAAEAGVSDIYVLQGTAGDDADEFQPGASSALHPFADLLAGDQPEPQVEPRNPQDTAVIIYTSGTTGKPKGAELSHIGLYMNADIPGRLFGFSADDVVVAVLPLFHVFGLASLLNISVLLGGTITLVERFDPAKVLEVIQRDKVTVFEGVPTMYVSLLHHPGLGDLDVSSLRVAISGGAAIPAEIIDSFEKTFGVVILEGYGLSETASTTTLNVSLADRRVYSVGKPIWGVSVQIWDDDASPLPPGRDHVGEIVIRGANVMTGYLDDPEATAAAFAGGWFHSGDLGYIDADGFLFIVDRKKDLIIRGGYNVYPREIEEVIYTHPSVAEAAVVGVADARLGEEVKAYVVIKPGQVLTQEELIAYLKERVAAYKYPRSVDFRDALPKGPSGKILKKDLAGCRKIPGS